MVHPPKHILANRPWLAYTLALLPLTIVLLAFAFYATLSAQSIYASYDLAEAVRSNPRRAAQVVALIGSCLTTVIKWSLSRAFVLTSQKRFRRFRSMFEAELWTSLKNGGVIMTNKVERSRILATFVTVLFALLCGALTSGFVSLLSPLPLQVHKQIVGARELDLLANSTACAEWYNKTEKEWRSRNQDHWLSYKNYKFMEANIVGVVIDVLNAGRASMISHIMTSLPSRLPQTFVSTIAPLDNTRILGSTAGVIPMGPGGIQELTLRALDWDPDVSVTNRQLNGKNNYTVIQQGLSVDVSCEYTDNTTMPYTWKGDDTIIVTCPVESYNVTMRANNQLVVARCPNETTGGYNFYLESRYSEEQRDVAADPKNVYAGIGFMRCSLTHYIGDIIARYDSGLSAFRMERVGPQLTPVPLPPIVRRTYTGSYYTLLDTQTYNVGNLAGSLIHSLALSLYGIPSGKKDDRYPSLVSSYIKGIFEYQATHLRLVHEASYTPAPEECRRPVIGDITYPSIGWEAQPSTLYSLIPLGIIGLVIAAFVVRSMLLDERLTLFDPTHPISLVAAASAGGVHFDDTVTGDPQDEVVRMTRVAYDAIPSAPPPPSALPHPATPASSYHSIKSPGYRLDITSAEEAHAFVQYLSAKWGFVTASGTQ